MRDIILNRMSIDATVESTINVDPSILISLVSGRSSRRDGLIGGNNLVLQGTAIGFF